MNNMGTKENLIPLGSGARTEEEERAIRSKGGKASQEARRRKKTLKEIAQAIGDSKVANPKHLKVLEALGLDAEEITNNSMVVASLYKEVCKGNVNAIAKWEEYVAADSVKDEGYQLPAVMLGKDYVDVNRNIKPNVSYVFKGGRGSLKSSFVALKIIELLCNNPKMHACVVRKVAGTLRDSVFAQIKWAINILGKDNEFECNVSPMQIKRKATGQIIYFRGVDDPTKLKSITPPFGYIGILWKEEKDQLAGENEERSINQSVLRGGKDAYDFSSYNPPKSKANWVNKEEHVPNDKRVIVESNYKNAPAEWLGTKFIEDAEHLKEVNPEAYEHEYMGVPNGDGGAVFNNVKSVTITDKEIESFDRIYQGVDWGYYPDPFAFVRLYYDSQRMILWAIDEYVVNRKTNNLTGKEILDRGYNDYPITCDSAEPKSIKDFRDLGIQSQKALKGAGSIEYGMKFLAGLVEIRIDPQRTPHMYKEFTEYEYERDKDGNVVSGYADKDNHTIDATRYALEKFYNRRGAYEN